VVERPAFDSTISTTPQGVALVNAAYITGETLVIDGGITARLALSSPEAVE
jgi:hypothetical protein